MKDDTISRAAALDALGERPTVWTDDDDYALGERKQYDMDRLAIETVPPAQPVNIAKLQPNCNQVASDCASHCASHCASDCISRQAAIETVRKAQSIGQAHRMLLQLPPAQPGWIPWDSGGFPEESGTYTVTAYDGATMRVTYAKYQKRLKRWELTGSRAYWKVLAWQPLPKPYREGGQE